MDDDSTMTPVDIVLLDVISNVYEILQMK